jgi:hypothetical protein
VALLEKRRFLYNHSGDFPQVILIIPSHVPNTPSLNPISAYNGPIKICVQNLNIKHN